MSASLRRKGIVPICCGLVLSLALPGCAFWKREPKLPPIQEPEKRRIPIPKIPLPKLDMPDLSWLNPFAEEPEPEIQADTSFGVEVLSEDSAVTSFHARAESFYRQLPQRRFNSILTFKDADLRAFFRSDDEFSDYYADFAFDLEINAFEKNRPLELQVVEFALEDTGIAVVSVRLTGDDARPLRYGQTSFEREDRWERHDGEWWIVPGKI